jgi:hypothetical protein
MKRTGSSKWRIKIIMPKQSHDSGRLEGTEAFGLYLTEIASSVLAISQQSALLLQALSERAVLLSDIAEQAESTELATGQTAGKAGQCDQAPGSAESRNPSTLATVKNKITAT